MIHCSDFQERKHDATVGCCAMLSMTSFTAGIVTALTVGSTCGIGYLLSGGISALSFFIIKNMKVSKNLEVTVDVLQSENDLLKENNKHLEMISEELQSDVEIITESVKMVGESTTEFMTKLKNNYEKLKQENDRHQKLNRQQGMFQLMQLFNHFDKNQDFILSEEELDQNEIYLRSMFPNYDSNVFNSSVSYSELCDALLPK
jgi:hypothetical protein